MKKLFVTLALTTMLLSSPTRADQVQDFLGLISDIKELQSDIQKSESTNPTIISRLLKGYLARHKLLTININWLTEKSIQNLSHLQTAQNNEFYKKELARIKTFLIRIINNDVPADTMLMFQMPTTEKALNLNRSDLICRYQTYQATSSLLDMFLGNI